MNQKTNIPKIAFMLGSLNRGGTETLLLDIAKNAKVNALHAMIYYRKTGTLENEFIDSGIAIRKIENKKNIFGYIKLLRNSFVEHKIEIAHAQQILDALYAWLASIFISTKVVLSMHGYDFGGSAKSKILHHIALRVGVANVYVSEHQKAYYTKKYKLDSSKQFVVYNGIDFKKFSNINTSNNIRTELNISQEILLMGMVGNFVKGRDPITVCKALVLLKNQGIAFQFVFVGKASDRYPHIYEDCKNIILENNLSDQVHFLGSRNDVPNILQQLDAYVYSTDHDTFGIAVVEAMAAGIPVLVNNWPVMTEISQNGKYASIYETKNENNLLRELLQFIDNRMAYKEKAAVAATYAKNTFSIEKHITNINALYAKIIASKE